MWPCSPMTVFALTCPTMAHAHCSWPVARHLCMTSIILTSTSPHWGAFSLDKQPLPSLHNNIWLICFPLTSTPPHWSTFILNKQWACKLLASFGFEYWDGIRSIHFLFILGNSGMPQMTLAILGLIPGPVFLAFDYQMMVIGNASLAMGHWPTGRKHCLQWLSNKWEVEKLFGRIEAPNILATAHHQYDITYCIVRYSLNPQLSVN